jgi:predicted  nucleic acid-binding Zn-ribbon protein
VVTAPLTAQLALVQLQHIDTGLDQIEHRRRTLPETAQVAAVVAELAEKHAERVRARTSVADLGRAQRKADADVEQVRTRRARDQQRLDSGSASPKELAGLSHELETLAHRQSDLEDVELEVMEQLEAATATVDELEQQVAELTARERAARQQLADVTADLDADRARLQARRAEAAAGIDGALIELYEKVRASVNLTGLAVAALENGRCSGCRVDLAPQELQRMRVLPADAVIRCDECRRILVRVELAGSAGTGIPA